MLMSWLGYFIQSRGRFFWCHMMHKRQASPWEEQQKSNSVTMSGKVMMGADHWCINWLMINLTGQNTTSDMQHTMWHYDNHFSNTGPTHRSVFHSRSSSSRTETSRAARTSASVTALRSRPTWAGVAPAGWRAGSSWSMTSPTSWASSTSWPGESILSIGTPPASMTALSPAALSPW